MNDKGFFYAGYSGDKVTVASKAVNAGHFAVDLLNQYYKDDTAARISVFRAGNWELEDMFAKGYLSPLGFRFIYKRQPPLCIRQCQEAYS